MAVKKTPARARANKPVASPTIDDATQKAMNKSAEYVDRLDSFADAEAATAALSETFAGRRYANRQELASTGTLFYATSVAFEPGEGFKGKDRWNVAIVDQFSREWALTLEHNPTRAGFFYALGELIARFGRSGGLKLAAYETKDGNAFYAIVPAKDWQEPSDTVRDILANAISA